MIIRSTWAGNPYQPFFIAALPALEGSQSDTNTLCRQEITDLHKQPCDWLRYIRLISMKSGMNLGPSSQAFRLKYSRFSPER